MPIPDITRDAILAALDEFDAIGRPAFLKKYGFGRSRGYYILHNSKEYDSKAILGAAAMRGTIQRQVLWAAGYVQAGDDHVSGQRKRSPP